MVTYTIFESISGLVHEGLVEIEHPSRKLVVLTLARSILASIVL
jgi:hypothetical protein